MENTTSTARGIVTVTMDNLSGLLDFVTLAKKTLEFGKFPTYLELPGDDNYDVKTLFSSKYRRYLSSLVHRENGQFALTIPFCGFGQFTYLSNIQMLFQSISFFVEEVDSQEIDLLYKLMLLEKEVVKLTFDFNDAEESTSYLTKNRIVIVKPEGQYYCQANLDILHQSVINIEFNARNLRNLTEYDCFGTEPESISSLIEGLLFVANENPKSYSDEVLKNLQEIRDLIASNKFSYALAEDISQEIASCSSDSNIIIYDHDYDPLRGSDLSEIISSYWGAISLLETAG